MRSKEQIRYLLTTPSEANKKKRFVLVSYYLKDRQSKVYLELEPALRASVSALNDKFCSGILSKTDAETLFRDLIEEQYIKANVPNRVLKHSVISKVNQKLFNAYWQAEYAGRFLVDERSMRLELQKALKLIEPLSLATASPQQIIGKLKSSTKSRKEMRRTLDRLNQFMRYLGKERLSKPPPGVEPIEYVTLEDFKRAANYLQGDVLDLAMTLFASGLRLSEALGLTETDLLMGRLNVDKQQTLKELKLPKREKTGRTYVIPELLPYVERWVKVQDKGQYRYQIYNELCRASTLAKINQATPKILRHSHAIYLLGKGATMTQVALNLRNRVDVCQTYYAGFAHTDDTLEGLRKLL